MLFLHEPSAAEIADCARRATDLPHNCPNALLANIAADQPDKGWFHDGAEATIGHGEADFATARQAIVDLVPFRQPWLTSHAPSGVQLDAVIGIQVSLGPIWSVSWSRVVEVVDTATTYSFVYRTTTDHGEAGEERFEVSLAQDAAATVTYRIEAVSRPARPYTLAVLPYVRGLQSKFRRGSIAAMKQALVPTAT
jgi:uncharacterized protein (UPF0548 family)